MRNDRNGFALGAATLATATEAVVGDLFRSFSFAILVVSCCTVLRAVAASWGWLLFFWWQYLKYSSSDASPGSMNGEPGDPMDLQDSGLEGDDESEDRRDLVS